MFDISPLPNEALWIKSSGVQNVFITNVRRFITIVYNCGRYYFKQSLDFSNLILQVLVFLLKGINLNPRKCVLVLLFFICLLNCFDVVVLLSLVGCFSHVKPEYRKVIERVKVYNLKSNL